MNFLAHFHLAWPDEGLIAGGLEGDYYKGPLHEGMPDALAQGIRLHRLIDGYTDRHPVTAELRATLPPDLRRYAGVLLDLAFDHYLAVNWSRYGHGAPDAFNRSVYTTLLDWQAHLSPAAQQMMERLVNHDLLALYRDWDTVTAAARRIGERFRRHNPFLQVDEQLAPLRSEIERGFLRFYPDLQQFSAEQRSELAV